MAWHAAGAAAEARGLGQQASPAATPTPSCACLQADLREAVKIMEGAACQLPEHQQDLIQQFRALVGAGSAA
jgi:hypothetical protein